MEEGTSLENKQYLFMSLWGWNSNNEYLLWILYVLNAKAELVEEQLNQI